MPGYDEIHPISPTKNCSAPEDRIHPIRGEKNCSAGREPGREVVVVVVPGRARSKTRKPPAKAGGSFPTYSVGAL